MINSVSVNVGAPTASPNGEAERLKEVAKQFEAVFLRQIIGSMRQASLGDDIFGSSATDQFRDMQDGKVADAMAEKGAIGIADLLVRQFAARVGTVQPAASAASTGGSTE